MRLRPGIARIGATALLFLGALGATESCKEPTSIEIEVRTTLEPREIKGTQFFVGGDPFALESNVSGHYASAETRDADGSGLVGTLVAVPPSGADKGRVSIVIVLGFLVPPATCTPENRYRGCIVARRQVAYRANERLRVPILLVPSCLDVPCDAVSTCANGACFSSSIDCDDDGTCRGPENGGPMRPPVFPLDGSTDGATNEGGADAASDSGSDATKDAPGLDAPAEGGPTPGTIACPPSAPCTSPGQLCCLQSGMSMCLPSNQACVSPTLNIRCDGPEDCLGFACCITSTGTACSGGTGCPGGDQLCNTNSDCVASKPSCTDTYASAYRRCK